jgi:hypothetical protein
MQHPLEIVPQQLRKPMFYMFFVLTLVIFGVFRTAEPFLRTSAAPSGIVSFELARNVNISQAIVDSWDTNARLYAAFGLGFDYLFMPVYAFALSLGILLASSHKTSWYRPFAAWMGWGVFVAALFDVVENYALWKVLMGGAFSPYPEIAALCATIKFILLILGLVTALSGRFFRN